MDDLDSKMESMRAHLERDAESSNPWAGYNPSLGRNLLNTSKFLASPVQQIEEPRAAPDFDQLESAHRFAEKKF